MMATYFKFKLHPGFTVGGDEDWGGEINIPYNGGFVKIKSHDGCVGFYFRKPGMPNVNQSFANEVTGALEPGREKIDHSNYAGRYERDDDPNAMVAKITAFRRRWFSLEKMNAGMLMVNTYDRFTYTVGGDENGGAITLKKDVWTTHFVLPEEHPYLAFQMTLTNA